MILSKYTLTKDVLLEANRIIKSFDLNRCSNIELLNNLITLLTHASTLSKSTIYIIKCREVLDRLLLLISSNMSLKNGNSAIIFSLIKIFDFTNDKQFLSKAKNIVLTEDDEFLESVNVSDNLFGGRSGYLLVLVYLYDLTHDYRLLKKINILIVKIINNIEYIDKDIVWYNPNEFVIKPLCSFGYGGAGLGFVLDLLSKYFNNNVLHEISKLSFQYVNGQCFDKFSGYWNDYRKDITTVEHLQKSIAKFKNDDKAFFNDPTVCHSMEDGTSGIVLSQYTNIQVVNTVIAPPSHVNDNNSYIDLIYMYIKLYKFYNNEVFLKNISLLFSKVDILKGNVDEIEIAILKLSLIKEQVLTVKFPIHDFKNKKSNNLLQIPSISSINSYSLKKHFKFTTQNSKESFLENIEKDEILLNPIQCFNMRLAKNIIFNSEDLITFYNYDNNFNFLKNQYRSNSFFYVKNLLKVEQCLNYLGNLNKKLLSEYVVLSDENQIKIINNNYVFWKYDCNKGIIEVQTPLLKFLNLYFKKPVNLKFAYYIFYLFIVLSKESRINFIIKESNSKNKFDLLKRLKFLFTYQMQFLIIDGVLKIVHKDNL